MPRIKLTGRSTEIVYSRITVTDEEAERLKNDGDWQVADELAEKYGAVWETETMENIDILKAQDDDGNEIWNGVE